MKKTLLAILAVFMVVALSLLAKPLVRGSSDIFISGNEGTALPDSIMKIVKVSCMDCHSDYGSMMAKSKLNFSAWESYKVDKQCDKANAACKILTKGSMPPKGFRAKNPNAVPTQAQINTICNWAKALTK